MTFTIKQARKYAGFTQSEMAKRLKIDRTTYLKIEKNPERATVEQVSTIARETGIPFRDLFLPVDSTLGEFEEGRA